MDFDRIVEESKNGNLIEEDKFLLLCHSVKLILSEEPTVVPISSPVTVCGDIHGQFYDLQELFRISGECPTEKYLFLGDFVDRGQHSLECIQLLLALKARYPDRIFLLRGNHESRQISHIYGFRDECIKKFGNCNVWDFCTELFDFLPLAALIDGKTFCVHGGLSPEISHIDQISVLQRFQEIPKEGGFSDLLWSDPSEDCPFFQNNSRGAGYVFGSKINSEFQHLNNLDLICRSHQLVMEGFKYMFSDKSLLTIWSAPNYCYRCGNAASVAKFDSDGSREIRLFLDVEKSMKVSAEKEVLPYFM